MRKLKLSSIIIATALVSLLLWNCEKEEKHPDAPVVGAPKCEMTLSGNGSEYNYGDTIIVDARTEIEYLRSHELFINDIQVYKSTEAEFQHKIYTVSLSAGIHDIKLALRDTRDSIGYDEQTIEIIASKPKILTREALEIRATSVTITGEYLSSGGKPTSWGVCYNTSGNPEKDENSISITDSLFAQTIAGLTSKTTYYARAWADNELGTTYGDAIQFTTSDETGTFTDFRDDKTYRWVKIGNQVWMAENLAYLPFLTPADVVPEKDSNIWVYGYNGTDISEAKQTENYKTYGALYSWKMANKYCPTGWHLPDTTEWNELIDYLGGEAIAGGKLKARGTEYWDAPNEGATNESGFTAMPGGYYLPNWDGFYSLNESAVYRQYLDNTADVRFSATYEIYFNYEKINYSPNDSKLMGLSVRCVKD